MTDALPRAKRHEHDHLEEARLPYEKPIVVKERGMNFPLRILANGRDVVCKQCSACHGCR